MGIIVSEFTILFENPFWIGIYEREDNGRYEVCKITFGAEPKDYEVYEFMLKNQIFLKFSKAFETPVRMDTHINPKRMQRLINKQLEVTGIGTKAQQALKFQREQGKLEHIKNSRENRELEKKQRFELRQQKHKQKHRGH